MRREIGIITSCLKSFRVFILQSIINLDQPLVLQYESQNGMKFNLSVLSQLHGNRMVQ